MGQPRGQVIQDYVNNHPPDEVVPVTAGRDLGCAGLQVAIGSLDHEAGVSPSFAAFCLAIPVVIFIVVLGLLNIRGSDIAAPGLTLLTAALVLAAAATPVLTLPVSTVLMVVLVVLLLAYHLAAAHRAVPG